ncbi:MAG: flagellar filament capping protein FliD [Gammaproteobacteria bacterium]|nr:flagellar filament capping protein FliD [Gammaproteobacteria bacterium]
MASVSSLGIGSGLDLGSLVSGLVEAERAPTENRLQFKEDTLTTELSAFGALRSSLSLFQGSLSSLSLSTLYGSKNISLSDSSVLSASSSSTADAGSYDVEVTALAKTHSLATNSATAFDDIDDTVGTGTLSIRFGTTTSGPYSFSADSAKAIQTITVSDDNSNTTLSGLRDYINDNDYGVQAAIVDDGNGFRLTLTSKDSGAANSMEITVTNDGDADNNDNAGLSQLAFNTDAQTSVVQTVAAQDAALKINGLDITRESNTIIGAMDGVTLNLLKADIGNTISVNVSESNEGIVAAVEEFVTGYNGLAGTINSLTNYDAVTSEAGILIGDFTVRNLSNQLRSVMGNTVSELTGNVRALSDIGITTNSDGTLGLDLDKLNTALTNNPTEVQALFNLQGRPTDSELSYSAATDGTLSGNYEVNVTTMATRAEFNATTLNSLTIDANNDSFNIKVDGVLSDQILLTQSVFANGASLASHIQAQINDDSNLKAAGVSVYVAYDSLNNEFDITSSRYGSASKVEFTVIDVNTGNDLGFSLASGADGVDVAGTINGLSATGNGQLLTSDFGDSAGLALLVSSGSTGSRGTVSFSRGTVSSIDGILNRFLENDGLIDNRESGLNTSLEDIQDDRDDLNQRISALEARLISKFSAMDLLVSQLNTTSNFLSQQLDNLPGSGQLLNK